MLWAHTGSGSLSTVLRELRKVGWRLGNSPRSGAAVMGVTPGCSVDGDAWCSPGLCPVLHFRQDSNTFLLEAIMKYVGRCIPNISLYHVITTYRPLPFYILNAFHYFFFQL